MKLLRRRFSYLLPPMALLLAGCDDPCPCYGPQHPSEAFARRYLFHRDSWWIYADSASGSTDTMRRLSISGSTLGHGIHDNQSLYRVQLSLSHTH
jgi:hypothetical protein